MINLIVLIIGIIFVLVSLVFVFLTARNTRNMHYEDFMRRKSEREKLRVPR